MKSKVASSVTASCAVELTDRSRLSPAPVPEALGSSPLAMPWPLGCQLPGSTSRSATPPTSQGNLADRPDAVPLPLLRRLPHHRDQENVTLGCPPGLCRRDGQVSVSAQPATGAPIKRHFRAGLRGRGHARQVRQVKQAAPPRRGGPRLGSGRPRRGKAGGTEPLPFPPCLTLELETARGVVACPRGVQQRLSWACVLQAVPRGPHSRPVVRNTRVPLPAQV